MTTKQYTEAELWVFFEDDYDEYELEKACGEGRLNEMFEIWREEFLAEDE